MRYVQRDKAGKVRGHYANEQPYAKELLPDNHPDLQEFEEFKRLNRGQTLKEQIAEINSRLDRLEKKRA